MRGNLQGRAWNLGRLRFDRLSFNLSTLLAILSVTATRQEGRQELHRGELNSSLQVPEQLAGFLKASLAVGRAQPGSRGGRLPALTHFATV